MKKRIITVAIAAAMTVSAFTPITFASPVSLVNIQTTGNEDIMDENGASLQDDTYQYGVMSDDYYAYMWVPQTAEHLNGVMVAKSNLIEVRALESKTVRDVLAKYNIGVVYLHARSTTDKPSNGNIMGDFVYIGDDGLSQYLSKNNYTYQGPANAGSSLDEMMARLACVSGYDELVYTPMIGVGHSAGMGLGRALGSWDPTRTIAQICMKGGTSFYIAGVTKDGVGDNFEIEAGVPTYSEMGQFTEHASYTNPSGKDNYADGELANFYKTRQKGDDRLLTVSTEWQTGHYDWSEKSNEALANYLDNVVPARLGIDKIADGMVTEYEVQKNYILADLTTTGYLADVDMLGTRTTKVDEADYNKGTYAECIKNGYDTSKMIWFVNESQYEFVKNFTADRKKIENISEDETTAELQYLKLEDPSTKTPKPFTRITRYDAVNPNNDSYANGLENDPMTFAMTIDKMNVVTEDHVNSGESVNTSDTPAYLVPAMAPLEWVGVYKADLTDSDTSVASKWTNIMRWKNNRVAYRMASQDSYVNLNTGDVYDNGVLKFAKATNTFQIYNLNADNSSYKNQIITFDDVENQTVSSMESGVNVNPTTNLSADGYYVDLMVEYGPVKAVMNEDKSYKLQLDQLPLGVSYPIEVKLVATQFGSTANGVNRAEPVEKIFYITKDTDNSEYITDGYINSNKMKSDGITGFNVSGAGTITLKMKDDTKWNSEEVLLRNSDIVNSENEYTKRHYLFPDGYNPYDYWTDRGEWTANVTESGFVPLSSFTKSVTQTDGTTLDKTNIDLTYINQIAYTDGMTVTPVTETAAVTKLTANAWGTDGVHLTWQRVFGNDITYSIYADGIKKQTVYETSAVVTGLSEGEHTFTVKTNDTAQTSVVFTVNADNSKYVIEDFEAGDLSSGTNTVSGAKTAPVYAWSSYLGESMLLKNDGTGNHYIAVQNTYTNYVQSVNINIPNGLTADMKKLELDIKMDKLEDSYPSGQLYVSLCNPLTGKSYGIEKGSDFALDDKDWHNGYEIDLAEMSIPTSELSGLTVLKIGRKVVGGGNNNRRGKMYFDNVALSSEEVNPVRKLDLTEDMINSITSGPNYYAPQNVGTLFNGDYTDSFTYGKQARFYIDLGTEIPIRRVVVYDKQTKTTNDVTSPTGTFMIGASNTPPSELTVHDYNADSNPTGYKTILRTNGSTQNGVSSSYADEDGIRKATAFEVSEAVGKIRYLSIYDWSNSINVSEIEVYVDEDYIIPIESEPVINASADVQIRDENGTKTARNALDGMTIELRDGLAGSVDYGFTGAFKFDISDLAGKTVNKIKMQFTTERKKNNNNPVYVYKISSAWTETNGYVFDDIIAQKGNAVTSFVPNGNVGKAIFDSSEKPEDGTTDISAWQTSVDITDMVKEAVKNGEKYVSVLLATEAANTEQTCFFSKDITTQGSTLYDNIWSWYTNNGSEIQPSDLYPKLNITYDGKEPLKAIHKITITENITGGAVKVNSDTAECGEVVSGIASANDGYTLTKVKATTTDGTSVQVSINNDGTFSFVMPEDSVTVSAIFKAESNYATKTTFINMPDTSIKSNDVQTGGNFMIGRGRISMLKLNLTEIDGIIDNAEVNFTRRGGANHVVGIFCIPNNNWTEDAVKGNEFTLDGTTKMNSVNGVSLFDTVGRQAVYPKAVLNSSGNDTAPSDAEQNTVAESAADGILKDYFFGDYIKSGETSADISATIKGALALNPDAEEITLMFYTPYTFASTLDFYSKDYVNITDSQKPSWTVNAKTPPEKLLIVGTPILSGETVNVSVSNTTDNDADIIMYVAQYDGDTLVRVKSITEKKIIAKTANDSLSASASAGDTVYVWDETQTPYVSKTILTAEE